MRISNLFAMAIAAAVLAGPARATLSIASAPTQNVTCNGGHCKATTAEAVLNVKDLRHLLATYPKVSVNAGVAHDMTFDAPLTWANSNALSLISRGPISVNKTITVAGQGAVNIQSKGMVFAPKARLNFWNLSASLTIDGNVYALYGDYSSLAVYRGNYNALAAEIDDNFEHRLQIIQASGAFVLDGLGHTISNLDVTGAGTDGGMFERNLGTIRNLNLENARVTFGGISGLVAGFNDGVIDHVSVSGTLSTDADTGGLVGFNDKTGAITNSRARVKISAEAWYNGGLVGRNYGTIANSYAEGELGGGRYQDDGWGGLVGLNAKRGKIKNSYSLVRLRKMMGDYVEYAGLIGFSTQDSSVESSYAAGKIEPARRTGGLPGGVVGFVDENDRSVFRFAYTYWDLDKGVDNPHQGAGSMRDLPGATGLTDAQLKSGLPPGFDPTVWGQNPNINSGYPYLISNPPQ
jgi:hypothetical protein